MGISSHSLKNRIILITGSGAGIGREIAKTCAREGALLGLLGRTRADVEETARLLEMETPGAKSLPLIADVSKAGEVKAAYQTLAEAMGGPPSGIVLAAGVNSPYGAIDQVSAEDWIRCFEINVFGVLHCVQEALLSMRKAHEGSIVLFSGAGQAAFPNFSAYAASKGAIWRLTETLGAELQESGIRINAIAPGAVNTRMMKEPLRAGEAAVGPKNFADLKKQESAGGVPASLAADLALFLLSDHSRGLSGKTISAQWDEYRKWKDLPALSRADLYTFKRVVREDGGTKP